MAESTNRKRPDLATTIGRIAGLANRRLRYAAEIALAVMAIAVGNHELGLGVILEANILTSPHC